MAFTDPNLARRFAQGITTAPSSLPLREKPLVAHPGFEHEEVREPIRDYLSEFLKTEGAESVLKPAEVDWEGERRKASELGGNYQIVGAWTNPDASVLAPSHGV